MMNVGILATELSLFLHYRKLFVSYNVKNAPRGCDHRTEEDCISNCAVTRKEGKPTLFYKGIPNAGICKRNGFPFCFWICAMEISCRNSYKVQNDRGELETEAS